MKKIVALLLAVIMILSMTACGMSRPVTKEEVADVDLGAVADGVYENAHFGLGCSLDESWDITPQTEVLALNEWDSEADLREQMLDSLAKPGYFYELMAEKEDRSATVTVCVENVAIMEDPDCTPENYVRSAVVTAREALSTVGIEGAIVEQVERDVAGEHCFGYVMHFGHGEDAMYQKSVYIHRGIYVAVITVSCTGEDITDELLDLFYQV